MTDQLAFVAETLETAEIINNLVRTNLRDGGYLLAEFRNFGGHAGEHAAAKLFVAAPRLLQALKDLVCYDSYSTEYDGRMYDICPSCGGQDGDHKAHCEFLFARAAIRAATE